MNDFARQTQEMFSAAKDARIPEQMQVFAEDSVSKARETYDKINDAAKDNAKAMEDVLLTAQAGAKSIGEKVMKNTESNTEAVFEAAKAIARADTLPEAIRLQTSFMQQQMANASSQSKELFEMGTKVAQETFETMNAAATKSFETLKKPAA